MALMIEKLQYLESKTGLVILPNILYTGVILECHITATNGRTVGQSAGSQSGKKGGHELPEWDDALLEPRAGGHLGAVANGKQVGAHVAPHPFGDELSDPVVHTRHQFIGLHKVRRDGVERVSVRVEDGRVAWVVALEP